MRKVLCSRSGFKGTFFRNPVLYLFLLCPLLVTGCFQYQYVTLNSNLYKNDQKEFMGENDTLVLSYSFTGINFPMSVTVYNKLKQPLYFDRQQSSVTMNNTLINAAFDRADQIDSIAPQTYGVIHSINLSDRFIPLSDQDQKNDTTVLTAHGVRHVKMHEFNEDSSPVLFTSEIALSTHRDLSSLFYYDQSFWVSGIFQSRSVKPAASPADRFYMQKATGFTTFMSYTSLTFLLLIITALTPT